MFSSRKSKSSSFFHNISTLLQRAPLVCANPHIKIQIAFTWTFEVLVIGYEVFSEGLYLDRGFWVFHHKKGEGVDRILLTENLSAAELNISSY